MIYIFVNIQSSSLAPALAQVLLLRRFFGFSISVLAATLVLLFSARLLYLSVKIFPFFSTNHSIEFIFWMTQRFVKIKIYDRAVWASRLWERYSFDHVGLARETVVLEKIPMKLHKFSFRSPMCNVVRNVAKVLCLCNSSY